MVLCIVTSSKLKPLLFLCISSLLLSCASGPKHTPTSAPQQTGQGDSSTEPQVSARVLYAQAGRYEGEAQHYHLLKAARKALIEQDNKLALAITESLRLSAYPLIQRQLMLPLLQAYLATAQHSHTSQLIDNTALTDVADADQPQFLWLSAQYLTSQLRYLQASKLLLQLTQAPADHDALPQQYALLWQNLAALSDSQLDALRIDANQYSLGWLNLAQLSRRYIGQPEQLQQAFTQWQQRYPGLTAGHPLPEAALQLLSLTPYQPQRIAVLLPLSGQFSQHAQAVQYGILSAASLQNNAELTFIDSQQPIAALVQQVGQAQADFVIGPLLKDQVDSISQSSDWPWPTLFLNSKDSATAAKAERYYFALSMEDEATQMAQLFQQKNYRRPVIISAASNISLRMQQRFISQWRQFGHDTPEHYQFNAKADLDSLINKLLETDRSRERLSSIKNLISDKVEAEPHSRLDIDAIYLIADPVQTRLFKPFVDVSVSPTAPKLPVYASSRSHSTRVDSTDVRDLNGLTFTEMPWLLGEQNSVQLRQQYQQIFAEQDETLQRLFAMGFDAYKLLGSLRQQQQLPAAVFSGLTGQLRLDNDGSLIRQLSWATYRNNRLRSLQEP
ncbi:MAG: penicillin-binding protein activator [Gammaproteobacteria bacterium]|nr:penicillin-binding protein activator [Gammaproteobacteria bacterium]MBU1554646.1 penicillin-binding protein activator [Gammaproteobacteria bacterium]MBU2070516.1 penicillin-binding protein activator [Gammaproteobacteria bacterium]MBU2185317.1 penicillin-binding protein activator [Gammaproteobacteria bacterium]MBU2203210.1 penicillin-binding protein activator [Gammaproteobacteria bacterium]